jgi:hypothetical protein
MIIIHSPSSLRELFPNGIKTGFSNFGFIPYDQTLVSKTYIFKRRIKKDRQNIF